jgi:hypothetical protein
MNLFPTPKYSAPPPPSPGWRGWSTTKTPLETAIALKTKNPPEEGDWCHLEGTTRRYRVVRIYSVCEGFANGVAMAEGRSSTIAVPWAECSPKSRWKLSQLSVTE